MSNIRKKADYPLVEVEWVDSSSTSGWQRDEYMQRTPLTCYSAGYLVNRDRTSLVVALNRAPDSEMKFGDTMTIPAQCVTKLRRLK